jgi:hypothetical protein
MEIYCLNRLEMNPSFFSIFIDVFVNVHLSRRRFYIKTA